LHAVEDLVTRKLAIFVEAAIYSSLGSIVDAHSSSSNNDMLDELHGHKIVWILAPPETPLEL